MHGFFSGASDSGKETDRFGKQLASARAHACG
jgi:hypothetical protein